MDPDSGFTSVRVGVPSPSVLGVVTAWLGGFVASGGAELEPAFRDGIRGGTSGGELDVLPSPTSGSG